MEGMSPSSSLMADDDVDCCESGKLMFGFYFFLKSNVLYGHIFKMADRNLVGVPKLLTAVRGAIVQLCVVCLDDLHVKGSRQTPTWGYKCQAGNSQYL